MLARARFVAHTGYSTLLPDLPAHGESPGERITFGAAEAAGVKAAVSFLRLKLPGERLGIIGVSLGAAANRKACTPGRTGLGGIGSRQMLTELERKPELGMLGGEYWAGRTTILVQYWRSREQLYAYAKNRDSEHLPAWREFNRSVGTSGDVGVWHETYVISPGAYENVYVNMPAFGLGKAGTLWPVTGAFQSAEARLRGATKQD